MALRTPEEFIQSIADLHLQIYLFGEKVDDYVDHPVIRPSINCIAMTYELAQQPEYAGPDDRHQPPDAARRSTASPTSTRAPRTWSRRSRCSACWARRRAPASSAAWAWTPSTPLYSRHLRDGPEARHRLPRALQELRAQPAGEGPGRRRRHDRPQGRPRPGAAPAGRPGPVLHVVERRDDGIVVRGAKAHQTGAFNSHWILVMPTMRHAQGRRGLRRLLRCPADAKGIFYIYGRQSCDTRKLEGGEIDVGNKQFGGQEALMIFDDVFVPWENVFMAARSSSPARWWSASPAIHRQSYGGCKVGVGDVLIGAAAAGRRLQRRRQGLATSRTSSSR